MTRCPGCNARLKATVICPRCRADLSALFNTEQAARHYFSIAIQGWENNHVKACVQAINQSLQLKQTKIVEVFRAFVIHQQCTVIMELLAQKQLLAAKQQLLQVDLLLPYSQELQQLHAFNDFLLVKDYERNF